MQQSNIRTSVLLYRHLLKCIRQLPSETQGHYKHHVRQGYASHCDETDPVRIQQIINRAVQDAEWLVKKLPFNSETQQQSQQISTKLNCVSKRIPHGPHTFLLNKADFCKVHVLEYT
ncbi:unnamed protein product [Porites lobata]|uniref:LYR motif-containing protein 9 n=1 Tax=Porites lobata TaxID=104759 RepID=A0ABN8NTH7_9CNID|nr:unnamed protein product [Porites lobata]